MQNNANASPTTTALGANQQTANGSSLCRSPAITRRSRRSEISEANTQLPRTTIHREFSNTDHLTAALIGTTRGFIHQAKNQQFCAIVCVLVAGRLTLRFYQTERRGRGRRCGSKILKCKSPGVRVDGLGAYKLRLPVDTSCRQIGNWGSSHTFRHSQS